MQDDSAKPPGGNFDIPDLDLPASGARPRAAQPRSAPVPSDDDELDSLAGSVSLGGGKAEDAFGGGFDASHFDSSAVVESESPAGGLDAFDADLPVGGLELRSELPPPPPAPAPGPAAPAAVGPPISLPQVGPSLIPDTAQYGPVPSSLLGTPAYALRVVLKKRELRQRLPAADAKLRDAEDRRDRFLADLVRPRLPALEGDERYAAALARIHEAEGHLQHGNQALSQVQVQMAQAKEQFHQQAEGLKQTLTSTNASLKACQEQEQAAETNLKRAEARQKRLLIEARNAHSAATGGQPAAVVPEQVQAQISQLQSQAAALEPEVAAGRQAVATAAMQTKQALLAQQQASSAMQSEQQRGAAQRQQLHAQITAQQATAGSAGSKVQTALAALTRILLNANDLPLDEGLHSQLSAADGYVERCSEEHGSILQALDSADGDAVQRGFMLVAAVTLSVIVLIVVLTR